LHKCDEEQKIQAQGFASFCTNVMSQPYPWARDQGKGCKVTSQEKDP
jgi:hypothetical protein